ncbi:hypothetical protein E2C01_060748 [Portunus trituberculatus]|uniref:Uncharacterized protein n=1 Tax=Portunus trituberculatus TaxID=210409 RepID=A0A5B7HCB5_PORTR|nr:hypothetical protein [Portunus trituberculatus]
MPDDSTAPSVQGRSCKLHLQCCRYRQCHVEVGVSRESCVRRSGTDLSASLSESFSAAIAPSSTASVLVAMATFSCLILSAICSSSLYTRCPAAMPPLPSSRACPRCSTSN